MKYMELGGSEALAGVGRANNASNVGNANYVYGVAGSDTFLELILRVPWTLPLSIRNGRTYTTVIL